MELENAKPSELLPCTDTHNPIRDFNSLQKLPSHTMDSHEQHMENQLISDNFISIPKDEPNRAFRTRN
jgi:hypothetical protein